MLDPDDSAVSCALIHVRLPASLLSTLSDESRIEIIHNQVGAIEDGDRNRAIAEEDGLTLTIAQDSSVDSFPLEVDKQKKHAIMWYQSSRNRGGEEDGVPQNELRHVGTTHKRYIIEAPSSATNLRRIGERTRRLLEEERKNRKEIVRLDHNDLLPLPKKNSGAPEKSPQAGVKMPHKKIGAKANNNSRKRKRHIASNVDGWMPNVDDLRSSDTTKDGRSNIVRLHGLPLGIKPEQIRKFFHGLNPGLIFVLPSFPHYIDGWDAMYNMDDMNSCMVNRHPSHFRLFAKFTSSPVANAAIERSGESIAVDTNYCKSELTGASISISPVSRSDASFIQKHMAIPAQNGESVIVTLKNVEKRLDRGIELIWRMAIKLLNLKHRIDGRGGDDFIGDFIISRTEPANKLQYQKLAKFYNQLIDTHAELERYPGLLYTHTFDPTLCNDPVHRIAQSVSNWLLDEISTIGRLLKKSR